MGRPPYDLGLGVAPSLQLSLSVLLVGEDKVEAADPSYPRLFALDNLKYKLGLHFPRFCSPRSGVQNRSEKRKAEIPTVASSRVCSPISLSYSLFISRYRPTTHMSPLPPLSALLLGLASILPTTVASPFDKADALAECLSKSRVPTDAIDSPDWKADVSPFNLRLAFNPVSIVVPENVQHIQDAVACAAKLGIKANAKCGGHSYGSFGLGGEDGHLTIEMDRMNKITLDTTTGIAKVEGGARLGHVASQLYSQGKRAFSHGTCPG